MRNTRRRKSEESEVNMTPMLDVVFIMLIFFIVTASFVKEAGVDVNRPPALTAISKDKGNILIAITENGQIWIDRRQVDPRSLRASIESRSRPKGPSRPRRSRPSQTRVRTVRQNGRRHPHARRGNLMAT